MVRNRSVYYFAYGSTMNPDRMRAREVEFKSYQRATLKDYELVFNKRKRDGSAAANIVPKKGSVVEGVLYELKDPNMGYFWLDSYKGYPDHYTFKEMEVVGEDGEVYTAVVYYAQPDRVREDIKPTEDYFEHILEPCRRKILSKEYCEKLRRMYREFFGKEPEL
jgi:cation transport regulator ChaC